MANNLFDQTYGWGWRKQSSQNYTAYFGAYASD